MHEQKAFAAWNREGFLAFCDPFAAIARLALALEACRLRRFAVSWRRSSMHRGAGIAVSEAKRLFDTVLPQLFAIGVGAGDISEQSRLLQQLKRCRMHSYTEPFKASVN